MASVRTRAPGSKLPLPPPAGGRFGSPHGSSGALAPPAAAAAGPTAAPQACPPTPETAGYGAGGGGRPRARSSHSGSATPSDDMSASLASAATSFSSAADQLLFAPASVEDAVHAVPSLLSQMLSGRTDEQVRGHARAGAAGCLQAGAGRRGRRRCRSRGLPACCQSCRPAVAAPSLRLSCDSTTPCLSAPAAGAGCTQAARLLPRRGAASGGGGGGLWCAASIAAVLLMETMHFLDRLGGWWRRRWRPLVSACTAAELSRPPPKCLRRLAGHQACWRLAHPGLSTNPFTGCPRARGVPMLRITLGSRRALHLCS